MSVERPWNPEKLGKFIQILEDFRRACGRPSLRSLERLSEEVVRTHKPAGRDLPLLTLATLSNVLNGRRSGPPDWRWVATFVLTCQRYAVKAGLAPADPGESTLPQWNAMLQAVYSGPADDDDTGQADAARPTGERRTGPFPGLSAPPDPPGAGGPPMPLAAPTADDLQPDRSGSVAAEDTDHGDGGGRSERDAADGGGAERREHDGGACPSDSPDHGPRNLAVDLDGPPQARPTVIRFASPEPVPPGRTLRAVAEELMQDYVDDCQGGPTLTEQRMFTLYGQHGVRLIRAAEPGDPQACFALGVLLCLDDRPQESLAWLMRAESGGHNNASALIESLAPANVAAQYAYLLGRRALSRGDAGAAHIYLERAARRRHASAAFELAAASCHDRAQAIHWFSQAAQYGHRLAQWWADTLTNRVL